LEGFDNLEKFWCYNNELTGLDVSQCPNLKLLDCNNNKYRFTSLNIDGCSKITELICRSNNLTSLDFLNNLTSEKLEVLYIHNNNFPAGDLTPFSRFVNLKRLSLGNYDYNKEWVKLDKYNRFYGSLEPLQYLTKLEELEINNTDISHGLEYLSKKIEKLDCSFNTRIDARVSDIWDELQPFGGDIKK